MCRLITICNGVYMFLVEIKFCSPLVSLSTDRQVWRMAFLGWGDVYIVGYEGAFFIFGIKIVYAPSNDQLLLQNKFIQDLTLVLNAVLLISVFYQKILLVFLSLSLEDDKDLVPTYSNPIQNLIWS